ncbi:hypothetical protein CAPTEDRAFT_146149 [Capitella teleta]|uniref:BTB domain-containing protein n=1 Tax=Capitella teleta TaxID=283909 RepID=R7VFU4_CAPTE|nr:hypothetical protein CAPTEDRAFT_146149 [Capitella teleta]|eukprot:ELU17698.1 hypothetical protein CAPTEDRAFT_146149 [Capitella teleta]
MAQAISSLPPVFLQMREAEEFTDVTLVFGEQRTSCHRVILAGMSEYFRRMFLVDMVESGAQEVSMDAISPNTGELLVHYMYTGHIEITTQNAQDLLEASDMLLLGALKQKIEEFLRRHTDSRNCISMMNLARLYGMEAVMRDAQRFLHELTKEVIATGEMHLLQEEDLIEILQASSSQENNFCFLQKWVGSAEGRADCFDALIQHVSLLECSKEFISTTVMDEKLMHNTRGMQLIQQAMQSSRSTNPPQQRALAVDDMNGEMWLCSDINIQHWQHIQKLPSECWQYSACASPGGFVVSGGFRNNICQRDCYSYDACDAQWSILQPMSIARASHSSIHHDHHLYIVGGQDGRDNLDSVETLDINTLQWSHLPPLPFHIQLCYLAIVSNSLFVLGGYNRRWSADVHEFDIAQQTWRSRSPMPEICDGGAAVQFDGHVFVVGGTTRSCMRFDPRSNQWQSLHRPKFDHYKGPSLVWKENILVCGGHYDATIEFYSPITDEWENWNLKMPKKAGMSFAVRL